VVVVAAPHANSLLLVGSASQIAELKRIIALMDVEPYAGSGNLRAIPLKYLAAEDAAKSLTALISKGAEKPQQQKISIEPNTANNSLLIYASPQDFEMVKKLVEQMDEPPQQVLVEVIFAEMTLSEGRDLGSTIIAAGSPNNDQKIAVGAMQSGEGNSELASTVMQGIAPEGLTFGLAKGSYVDSSGKVVPSFPFIANIKAIDQSSNFKILSSIPLWAQNNQAASVTVGKNIPILKSTIAGGSGTARDVIENIDRIDVGIKLAVTPHINPNGEVLMKLEPSIEAILEASTGGKEFTPTIAKREVSTTMTVPDGDTIVISGLIREDVVKKERKIPLLGSIPIIGWLFKTKSDSIERTNLLIFVTPRVIKNAQDARSNTGRIRQQTLFNSSVTNVSFQQTNEPAQK
jgi:general secretion pathway protein D